MAYSQSEHSFQPKKLRKPGVTILKEILKTIKLDENLMNENNLILRLFLESFIDEMKLRDELFKEVFQKVHYTGSFYSDLRISEPNEFDINIILKMPFKPCDLIVEYCSQVPSYAKYQLLSQNSQNYAIPHAKLLRTFFQDGYLMHEKVRKWMQGVVDKALSTYTLPRGVIRISPSSSGPARTIQLQKKTGGIIDIDLVPVLSCILQTKQPGIDQRVCAKLGSSLETFLVPKQYSYPVGKQLPVNPAEISRLWRTHFPVAENDLIHNLGCIKPIIKLMKLLRDKENWKILASYYLKTVAMWMLLENPSKEYWKEDKIDERFIEALQKLQSFVKAENLPYFFSKKHNLISKINSCQASNISNRLTVIIRDARSDPKNFWKIFNVQPTF